MIKRIFILREKVNKLVNDNNIWSDNVIDILDDYTGNFDDLKYWNTYLYTHGKNINFVKIKLRNILNNLACKHVSYDLKELYNDPIYYGRKRKDNGENGTELLSKNERVSILMFHLSNLLTELENINETAFVFTDNILHE